MRKTVVFAATAMAVLPIAPVRGMDFDWKNIYLRLDSGYSWSEHGGKDIDGLDVGDSIILGGGIGYRLGSNVRIDFMLAYRGWYQIKGDLNTRFGRLGGRAHVQSIDGLLNAYYDIGRYGPFTPYVGAGVGFAFNNVETLTLAYLGQDVGTIAANSQTELAWQISAGTAIDIAPNTSLDVGYRYLDLGPLSTAGNGRIIRTPIAGLQTKADLSAHELQIGLRYSF
jgi:opacity protein-like surface antigen